MDISKIEFPEEWKILELGEITHIILGQSPPGESYNETGNGTPFLQGKAEFTSKYPLHRKFTTRPIKIAPQNSILISVRAPVGDVNIADIEYCIGRGLASLSPKKGDNSYLFYILFFLKREIEKEGTGSTFKAINKSKLQKIKIPIPPIEEQQSIARILSAVQEAREKTDAVIDAARTLKKSMMKHLFTYGPIAPQDAPHITLKETEIGAIPEEWEITSIKNIGEAITGTTPSTKVKEYYGNKYMFISPADINENKYVNKSIKYLSEKGYKISRHLPKNAVLVVCIGSIGKTAMTSIDGCTTNQQINAIIPNNNINPHFLYYSLSYRSLKLKSLAGKVTIPIVNKRNFEKFIIPFPDIIIQDKIAEILSGIDIKIEAEENKKAALDALFKSLLENLMTGKIRVHQPNQKERR